MYEPLNVMSVGAVVVNLSANFMLCCQGKHV